MRKSKGKDEENLSKNEDKYVINNCASLIHKLFRVVFHRAYQTSIHISTGPNNTTS